jgi:hypothetical protein
LLGLHSTSSSSSSSSSRKALIQQQLLPPSYQLFTQQMLGDNLIVELPQQCECILRASSASLRILQVETL